MMATHNCIRSITKFSLIFFVKCKETRELLPNQKHFWSSVLAVAATTSLLSIEFSPFSA
jgi:hypothetical protein